MYHNLHTYVYMCASSLQPRGGEATSIVVLGSSKAKPEQKMETRKIKRGFLQSHAGGWKYWCLLISVPTSPSLEPVAVTLLGQGSWQMRGHPGLPRGTLNPTASASWEGSREVRWTRRRPCDLRGGDGSPSSLQSCMGRPGRSGFFQSLWTECGLPTP